MAAKANIYVDQGSTFSTDLSLTDSSGNPIDLTNYTVQGKIRKWYTSNSSVSFSVSIPTPTNGTITISLDYGTTANMSFGRYVYDIDAKNMTANSVTRLVEGILTVNPTATY